MPRRGECQDCHFRQRLRKDGTIGAHQALRFRSAGDPYPLILEKAPCEGTGQSPAPLRFEHGYPLCEKCCVYLYSLGFMLSEAIYSTAIENGGHPQQMYEAVFRSYHANDHREAT